MTSAHAGVRHHHRGRHKARGQRGNRRRAHDVSCGCGAKSSMKRIGAPQIGQGASGRSVSQAPRGSQRVAVSGRPIDASAGAIAGMPSTSRQRASFCFRCRLATRPVTRGSGLSPRSFTAGPLLERGTVAPPRQDSRPDPQASFGRPAGRSRPRVRPSRRPGDAGSFEGTHSRALSLVRLRGDSPDLIPPPLRPDLHALIRRFKAQSEKNAQGYQKLINEALNGYLGGPEQGADSCVRALDEPLEVADAFGFFGQLGAIPPPLRPALPESLHVHPGR